MVDLLKGRQVSPCLQFSYVFNFCICFQHHEIFLCHHDTDIDHLLANLPSLLSFLGNHEFDFLLAGEDPTVRIIQPNHHIVIQIEVETS